MDFSIFGESMCDLLRLEMALPALGGMAVELLTLFVVPVLYSARRARDSRP